MDGGIQGDNLEVSFGIKPGVLRTALGKDGNIGGVGDVDGARGIIDVTLGGVNAQIQ